MFNPGAFTHYAYALADALAAFDGIVVELHLSNPHAREPWRHTSVVAPVATGTIAGFGAAGYRLAIRAVSERLKDAMKIVPATVRERSERRGLGRRLRRQERRAERARP